jgi:hypothetical protein
MRPDEASLAMPPKGRGGFAVATADPGPSRRERWTNTKRRLESRRFVRRVDFAFVHRIR